jgi:hypothetical protein
VPSRADFVHGRNHLGRAGGVAEATGRRQDVVRRLLRHVETCPIVSYVLSVLRSIARGFIPHTHALLQWRRGVHSPALRFVHSPVWQGRCTLSRQASCALTTRAPKMANKRRRASFMSLCLCLLSIFKFACTRARMERDASATAASTSRQGSRQGPGRAVPPAPPSRQERPAGSRSTSRDGSTAAAATSRPEDDAEVAKGLIEECKRMRMEALGSLVDLDMAADR